MNYKKKKIAYITSMVKGGLAGFNYRELMQMDRLGVKVTLFVTKYNDGPYLPPEGVITVKPAPIKILVAQLKYFISSPIRYLKYLIIAVRFGTVVDYLIAQDWKEIIVKEELNWIHCHWGDRKLYIGYFCSKLTSLPLSVTLHGYDLYANPNWKMFEECIKNCNKIITISNYNVKLLKKKYGDLVKNIEVIRLSADLVQNPRKLRDEIKVLIVGGFEHRKGYDTLLEAFQVMNRKDIRLWIVGYKGPVDVANLIDKYNVQDRVTLFGHVSDEVLKLLFLYCDIFTMPSRMDKSGVGEGLPVALMEAMSYEKPIVATKHTGIPELVPDILVDENDIQGLAAGIEKLADDSKLRETTGKRNRKIIEEGFSNRNVGQLLDTFKL